MPILIDANAFLSSMIKRFKCVPLIGRNDYDCESLKQMLIEAPTVDAVEVVHGRNLKEDWPSLFECSVCGCDSIDTYTFEPSTINYCPNCGADMRERNTEDDN